MRPRLLPLVAALAAFSFAHPSTAQGGEPAPVPAPEPAPVQEPAPATGQDVTPQDPQTEVLDVKSRVRRSLEALRDLTEYEFEVKETGGTKSFGRVIIQAGAGGVAQAQGQEQAVSVKKKGDVVLWSQSSAEQVLARRGAQWLARMPEGSWLPSRKPTHPVWQGEFLPEPDFLAERLLQVLADCEWERTGDAALGSRPARGYRVMLEGDAVDHLMDSGALPQSSPLGGAFRLIGLNAGGRVVRPKTDTKIEITLFENPSNHLPLQILVKTWSKQPGNVQVFVQGAGGLQQGEDEEKEELGPDGKKRPKPTSTVTFDLVRRGRVQTPELDDEAQKLLGLPREGL